MNEKQKPTAYIIHHSADADGRFSGMAAMIGMEKSGYECIPLGFDYHEDWEKTWNYITDTCYGIDAVVMTDISFPLEAMKHIQECVEKDILKEFIWIDHHISAMKEMGSLYIDGLRKDGVAACELAHEYFNIPMLKPANLVSQYDVWQKDGVFSWNQEVIPFQYYIRSCDIDITQPEGEFLVRDLITRQQRQCGAQINAGVRIIEYEKNSVKLLQFFDVEFEGIKFRAVNKKAGSTVFEFAEETGDSLMAFSVSDSGFSFSMYKGEKEVDLSLIAKRYGGGGHANACGFQVDLDDGVAILRGEYSDVEEVNDDPDNSAPHSHYDKGDN